MNGCSRYKLLFGCLLLLLSNLAFAGSATVDCSGATPGAFTTITAALASLPTAGPNSISVTGNCTENVNIISRTQLNIFSAPGTASVTAANPNARILLILGSQQVFIDGINFNGGRGVLVNNSTDVQLGDGTFQNSSLQGISTFNSTFDIFNATVQNALRSGIASTGGTVGIDGGVTISHNGRAGVSMITGHLIISGGDGTPGTENVISNNGSVGVSVANSSEVDIAGDNRILSNGTTGLQVIHTSTAIVSDSTINGNQGVGVHIGETSHGEFSAMSITSNGAAAGGGGGGIESGSGAAGGIEVVENSDMFIDGSVDVSNNLASGIFVSESSVLSSLGGNTVNNNDGDGYLVEALAVVHFFGADTATGNTKAPLECDTTSLLLGDKAGLGGTKCKITLK
jgi:Right handed beta helix region